MKKKRYSDSSAKDSPKLLSQINKTIKEVKDKGLIDKYMTNAANAMNDDSGFISKYGSFS